MKSILNSVYQFFESYGKVRAATAMARMGDYKLALAIIESK